MPFLIIPIKKRPAAATSLGDGRGGPLVPRREFGQAAAARRALLMILVSLARAEKAALMRASFAIMDRTDLRKAAH